MKNTYNTQIYPYLGNENKVFKHLTLNTYIFIIIHIYSIINEKLDIPNECNQNPYPYTIVTTPCILSQCDDFIMVR